MAVADFSCMSRKCEQDGAAPVFELPLNATRCPVCGSRRLKRLFTTAPAVLTRNRALQRVIDDAGSEAEAREDVTKAAELRLLKAHAEIQGPKPPAPMFAVPLKQLGAALKSYGLSTTVDAGLLANSQPARPMTRPSEAVIDEMRRGGVRTQIALRDRARISQDGTVTEASG